MRLEFIAFNLIDYNPAINARGDKLTDVSEVEATLKAEDFAQPMLLRPAPAAAGRFEPVDGGRRYHAARNLVAKGEWPDDKPIPALVRDLTDAEAIELSLAAAVTRLDLNPADEAMSFAKLVKAGTTPDDIAARFGVPLRRVKQRLAISALPEKIVSALRDGTIALDVAQAFTLGSDNAQREKVFNSLSRERWGMNPHNIRSQLMQKRISGTSREAKFIGAEAYARAGGIVEEDLFSNAVWFNDGKLLAKLVNQKLADDEARFKAEGWSFVIVDEQDSYNSKHANWPAMAPEGKRSLTPEEAARAAELKKIIAARDEDDDDDAAEIELAALSEKPFSEAQKARAGVVIARNHQNIYYRLGVLKPAEAKKQAAKTTSSKARHSGESRNPASSSKDDADADFSGALNTEMATAMTTAMQREIVSGKHFAALMAAVIVSAADEDGEAHPFHLQAFRQFTRPTEETEKSVATLRKRLSDKQGLKALPELFEYFRADRTAHEEIGSVVMPYLASLFALRDNVPPELKPLIDAFNPDVSQDWQPHEDFFKKLPRESLAAALGEAAIPDVTPSKKKRELVEMAVRHLVPMGWLPKPLRTPCYKGPGSNQWSDAHAAMTADKIAAAKQPPPLAGEGAAKRRERGKAASPKPTKATRAATKRVKAAALRKAAPAKKKPRK